MKKVALIGSLFVTVGFIVIYAGADMISEHTLSDPSAYEFTEAKLDGAELARVMNFKVNKWRYKGVSKKMKWHIWAELYDNSDIAFDEGLALNKPKDPEMFTIGYGQYDFKNNDTFILLLPPPEGGRASFVTGGLMSNTQIPPMSKNYKRIRKKYGFSYPIEPSFKGKLNEKALIGNFIVCNASQKDKTGSMNEIAAQYTVYCNIYFKLSDKDINRFYLPNSEKPFAVF